MPAWYVLALWGLIGGIIVDRLKLPMDHGKTDDLSCRTTPEKRCKVIALCAFL